MVHAIAERKVRQMFAQLSNGDYENALRGLAPRFEHVFAGNHALGGTRHSIEDFRAWFERLYRLFPNLDFDVGAVTVSGPPWDLVVVAEWIDRATPAGGGTYENHGVHVVRIVWGKLASLHAYLDTQALADTLRAMAANGMPEAIAAPIGDPASSPTMKRPIALRARPVATGSAKLGALALGALAIGATAIGALAIGRVAIGRLTVRDASIGRLEIDELVVRRSGAADL